MEYVLTALGGPNQYLQGVAHKMFMCIMQGHSHSGVVLLTS